MKSPSASGPRASVTPPSVAGRRHHAGLLDPFVGALLATVCIATLWPVPASAGWFASDATTAAICLMFFLHGASLSPRAAWDGMRRWRLHLLIFSITFGLFPLLGLALRVLEPSILTPSLYAGVAFLCVLPSTVQSSIAFTSIAGGNVATAICSASASNLAGVVLSPTLAALIIGSSAKITGSSAASIVGELVLPFAAGQLARPRMATWIREHPRITSSADRGSVLLIVYSTFSASIAAGLWHSVTPARLGGIAMVDAALLATVLGLSATAARWRHLTRADRIAVIFCGSKKSLGSGVAMATILFSGSALTAIILPLMLFHLLQLVVCAALARRWKRDDPEAAGHAPEQPSAAALRRRVGRPHTSPSIGRASSPTQLLTDW